MTDLLTREEALARVLERAGRLESEEIGVPEAVGRFLAEDAIAATDLPPFPSSAMDGFAVRSTDLPGTLTVVGRIAAGRPAERSLERGEAMGIATGGSVPEGADAVVPVEESTDLGATVQIDGRVQAGHYVREPGGDVRAGGQVLSAGTRIGPAQLGALAAAGVTHVSCPRAPRLAILVTGTELRPPGEPLRPGEIYESNGAMLEALFKHEGALVERLAPVEDDEAAHRAALEHALTADVVVTTGGVSVGPHDLVRSTERALGVEEVFWGVAVRPGKPLAFGVQGSTLVFGLPGNPVSSLVGAELFVRPALRAMRGDPDPGPRFEHGVLARPVRPSPRRDDLLRVRTRSEDGVTLLLPIDGQASHMIVRGAAADALALVPRGADELPEGAAVGYLRLA